MRSGEQRAGLEEEEEGGEEVKEGVACMRMAVELE